MSAVVEAREPSAKYLSALQPPLVQHFELLGTAPGGVVKLRELILTLAVQGKLVTQQTSAESAKETLDRSRAQMRERMLNGGGKKEKPSAVITEEEVPFSLPSGWQWCRLTDTGEYVNGLAFKPSDFLADGLPVIRIQNLSGRSSDFNRAKGDFPTSVLVKAGDILVSWSATLDAFIWKGEDGVLNQHIFRVEPSPAVDKGFLFWLLKWAIRDLAASDHAHGLVMSHINRGPFLSKPIGLPPLDEQTRIVTRVEELMRLCDALEAKGQLESAQHAQLVQTLLGALIASASPEELADNWQRVATHFDRLLDRPEAIDALEQTILQLAVRGLLVPQDPQDEPASELLKKIRAEKDRLIVEGKIKRDKPLASIAEEDIPFKSPKGWAWARWGSISMKIGDIDHKMPSEVEEGIPYVSPRDFFGTNEIDFEGAKKISRGDYLDLATKIRPEVGDLIYPRYGTIGVVRKVVDEREFLASYSCAVIKVLRGYVEPDYQYLFSISRCAKHQAAAATNKTTQPNVGIKSIQEFLFPLPPLAEQSRIVARVDSLRRLCADLRQRLAARQTTQAHLAEALIDEVA